MRNLSRLSAIVVDDHEIMRDLLARVLKDHELGQVREAAGGAAALAMLQEAPADLVFADYTMPGMNGAALVKAIRADGTLRQPRIIIISGVDDPAEARALRAAGADAVLVKPVMARAIMDTVHAVLSPAPSV